MASALPETDLEAAKRPIRVRNAHPDSIAENLQRLPVELQRAYYENMIAWEVDAAALEEWANAGFVSRPSDDHVSLAASDKSVMSRLLRSSVMA